MSEYVVYRKFRQSIDIPESLIDKLELDEYEKLDDKSTTLVVGWLAANHAFKNVLDHEEVVNEIEFYPVTVADFKSNTCVRVVFGHHEHHKMFNKMLAFANDRKLWFDFGRGCFRGCNDRDSTKSDCLAIAQYLNDIGCCNVVTKLEEL